jgi:hypothetical protein
MVEEIRKLGFPTPETAENHDTLTKNEGS